MAWISVLSFAIFLSIVAGIVLLISMGDEPTSLSLGNASAIISMVSARARLCCCSRNAQQEQRISRLEKQLEEKSGQGSY